MKRQSYSCGNQTGKSDRALDWEDALQTSSAVAESFLYSYIQEKVRETVR